MAGEQIKREDRDYQAWDALGIAYFEMALIEYSQFLTDTGRAFAKARAIASAAGAAKRNRILLTCFQAEPDLTEAIGKPPAAIRRRSIDQLIRVRDDALTLL